MKKVIAITVIILGLIGCSINCPSMPPKRAVMHQGGGMGMQYYFTLYLPMEGTSHSPTLKCPKQEYQVTHVYTDDLGTVQRENLIWKIRLYGNEYRPIPETDVAQSQTTLTFTKKDVIVQGLTGNFEIYNGTYKIETSSPESWGIALVE
jgi:hypothetical protein